MSDLDLEGLKGLSGYLIYFNSENMRDSKSKDITKKIIGCAMRVHAVLGNGFQEVIYQRATN